MRRTEKKIEPREVEVTVEYRCDLCGKDGLLRGWRAFNYEVADTEVKMRTGHAYPEGGSGEEVKFDICTTCFAEKLVPWLEGQGATPTRSDWDW